jgi:ferritin-like metal-binding protein YciE
MAWLRAFLSAAATGAAVRLLRASGSVALVGWVAPVMFAHSDIACWMSLIAAAEEEGYTGRAAVHRADRGARGLVAGRKAHGVAVG